jgi:UDP:flavonoid glycosyltransferase YjiC (YdhE family)
VARRVRDLLADPEYAERARIAAEEVARENGVKTACDALEKLGTGKQ